MARRVHVDAGQFVVGPPGIDCLSAPETDLIFSNRAGAYNGLHLIGVLAASAFSETHTANGSGGDLYTRVGTVAFGKTFPAPPRVLVGAEDIRGTKAFLQLLNFGALSSGSGSAALHGSVLTMYHDVSTTQLTITVQYLYYDGAGYDRNVPCPYVVFLA